ncbi:MAG: hypothetical protein ABIJ75_01215 [Actinomycetota bacterium]
MDTDREGSDMVSDLKDILDGGEKDFANKHAYGFDIPHRQKGFDEGRVIYQALQRLVAIESRVSVEAIAPIIKAELDWGTDGIITPDYVDIALAAARMVVAWINGEGE